MRAIDTNVLVYATIERTIQHARAKALLEELATGSLPWAIPWPCIYEFLRVVTHPHVYHPALSMEEVLKDLGELLATPTLKLLHETSSHLAIMNRVVTESGATGNLVHDAHIAALCLEHGVSEFLTGDRDFARFPSLRVRNPFA